MKKENMYVPSGLKTRDGKDIMWKIKVIMWEINFK